MRHYRKLEDGEVRTITSLPSHPGIIDHKIACCDCGLTHRVRLNVKSRSRVEMQWWRDRRATAAKRRGRSARVRATSAR